MAEFDPHELEKNSLLVTHWLRENHPDFLSQILLQINTNFEQDLSMLSPGNHDDEETEGQVFEFVTGSKMVFACHSRSSQRRWILGLL